MTAARDDDFIALPGMEADSTDTHHARERLSDEADPTSSNASPNASSKSALDALLDEYRARDERAREGHVVRLPQDHGHVGRAVEQRHHEGLTPPRTRRLATKTILPWGPRLSTYQRSAILPLLN